jgi:hypothetical protein
MKKLIYLLAIIFAVSFTTTITSCGGDDPTEENGNTGNGGGSENGGSDNGSGTMTPSQQKNKLENTTISFLEEFDAANFEDVVDLATYISEVYSDYDYDAIEEWGATCLESMVDFIDTWTDTEDYGSWGYYYTYNQYNMLFKISSFKGSFVAKSGRWKRTDANYLSFTVKDENGNDCVLKLTTSGKEKKVYVGDEEEWEWIGYDDNDFYEYNIDIYNNYIYIPANINITIERAGNRLAEVVINTDLASMAGEEFDLSRDKYNVSATFKFNGYSVIMDKFKYTPAGNGSEISYTIKHGNKNLLNMTMSSELDVENGEFYGADNNNISINLMDAVQFKGFCSDVNRLIALMDDADECDDESEFKEYVRKMNNLINIGLYYDKKNVKYANVELEAFIYEDYWGEEWYYTPVIVFDEDGTSYSFEEFFNERDFRNLIRTLERLMEDYEYLLEDAV